MADTLQESTKCGQIPLLLANLAHVHACQLVNYFWETLFHPSSLYFWLPNNEESSLES